MLQIGRAWAGEPQHQAELKRGPGMARKRIKDDFPEVLVLRLPCPSTPNLIPFFWPVWLKTTALT